MTNEEKTIKIIEKSIKAIVGIAFFENKTNAPQKIKQIKQIKEGYYINGSGFFIDKNGLIATTLHILSPEIKNYLVIDYQGKKMEANLICLDQENDLALLKIKEKNNTNYFLKTGDANKLKLGQTVIAIGQAFGIFKNTVSVGVISGLSRDILTQDKKNKQMHEMQDLIQTDLAINPGNSGGPLINLKGEVIGINVASLNQSQNINFAIPINYLIKDVKDYKKFGEVKKAFLGIKYIIINEEIKEYLKLPVNYGVLITSQNPLLKPIIKNSPADKAGLKENDIILTWQNQKIDENNSLKELIELSQIGEKIKIKILRKNKILEKTIILQEKV